MTVTGPCWASVGPSADPELDLEVWRLAEQEVANGWAVLEDVDPSLLLSCVLSRRFRVRQGSGKVRAIDDFSCSSVNCTLGTLDKITTMSTAHSVSLILRMMLLRKPGGLVGRCFDLKSAYRQLAVGLHSLPFAKVAVWDPVSQRVRILAMKAMLFAFLWSAGLCRALSSLMTSPAHLGV